jgi:hypothetical protein
MRIARMILLLAALPAVIVACGERSEPLTPNAAIPRLAITGLSIQGPSAVTRWNYCSFRAVPSGGTAPYTYAWSVVNGSGSAGPSGAYWTGYTHTTSMTLTVKVTDALGATRTVSKSVAGVLTELECAEMIE